MNARTVKAAVTAALMTLALAACGSDDGGETSSGSDLETIQEGTLTVCSDVPYPPFEDFDKSTESGFTGFDVEIVEEIAKGLELELAIKDAGFEGLQSGLSLNSQQCDMVASAMTITEEREENIDFTEPYYDSKQSLLVPEGSDIASIDDLAGKRVGVQQGTTGKAYTEENAPDAEIVSFPSDAEMYPAIKAGQVDALLQDLPVNVEHQKDGGFTIVEEYSTDESYGFGLAEEGTENLLEEVNAQLQEMRDSGKYDEIYNKYFSAS
jgi:polar amino acid transport system substrate-binding protein